MSAAGYGYPDAMTSLGLLAIFGENLAGEEAEAPALDRFGAVGPGSPDVPQVTFRGGFGSNPFPVLFASPNQLVVQAPYTDFSFVGRWGPVCLSLRWEGIEIAVPGSLRVQEATPALFVTGGLRDGLVAALNQDGSVHGTANPARAGSIVQLFAAGLGNTRPQPAGGDPYSSLELSPLLTFPSVTIGGLGADLIYGGGAPGLLGGVYQVNVRVPEGLAAGDHEVVVRMTGVAMTGIRNRCSALCANPLFVPQSLNRINLRCLHRGINPKQHAHANRHPKRYPHRQRRDDGIPLGDRRNNPTQRDAKRNPR